MAGTCQVKTELLFAMVRGTLYELLGDAKYLGAQPGQEPMAEPVALD